MLGFYSKREFAHLTEQGYKTASRDASGTPPEQGHAARRPKSLSSDGAHFYAIHPVIEEKCGSLFEAGEFAAAVELGFKIVRDRLRELTKQYETGSEAFGKGRLHIQGAAATHVDEDFNKGVQFLLMSIDRFRNEKSHTADARIDDPVRAHQYLSLSSLALSLLEKAEVLKP